MDYLYNKKKIKTGQSVWGSLPRTTLPTEEARYPFSGAWPALRSEVGLRSREMVSFQLQALRLSTLASVVLLLSHRVPEAREIPLALLVLSCSRQLSSERKGSLCGFPLGVPLLNFQGKLVWVLSLS